MKNIIEFKGLSLNEAVVEDYGNAISSILEKLSKIERIFLLKKGESTVSLEERRISNYENNAAHISC